MGPPGERSRTARLWQAGVEGQQVVCRVWAPAAPWFLLFRGLFVVTLSAKLLAADVIQAAAGARPYAMSRLMLVGQRLGNRG